MTDRGPPGDGIFPQTDNVVPHLVQEVLPKSQRHTVICFLRKWVGPPRWTKWTSSVPPLQGKATGTYVHFDPAQDGIERQTLTIRGPMLKVYRAHALLMKRYHETHETQAEAAWIWNESI